MRDPVDIARAILADPLKRFTLSVRDTLRICQALMDLQGVDQSVITTDLADAARALIAAEGAHTMSKGPDGYAPLKVGLVREMAFLTFKARFEQEFPND